MFVLSLFSCGHSRLGALKIDTRSTFLRNKPVQMRATTNYKNYSQLNTIRIIVRAHMCKYTYILFGFDADSMWKSICYFRSYKCKTFCIAFVYRLLYRSRKKITKEIGIKQNWNKAVIWCGVLINWQFHPCAH